MPQRLESLQVEIEATDTYILNYFSRLSTLGRGSRFAKETFAMKVEEDTRTRALSPESANCLRLASAYHGSKHVLETAGLPSQQSAKPQDRKDFGVMKLFPICTTIWLYSIATKVVGVSLIWRAGTGDITRVADFGDISSATFVVPHQQRR